MAQQVLAMHLGGRLVGVVVVEAMVNHSVKLNRIFLYKIPVFVVEKTGIKLGYFLHALAKGIFGSQVNFKQKNPGGYVCVLKIHLN